jgi:hypothetical protein
VSAVPLRHVSNNPNVVLASFDGQKDTTFKWSALNDPVMGGRSTSTAVVADGALVFNGTTAIVPSLKAPGFCKATTQSGYFSHNHFNDASHFINGSLLLKVRSSTPEYKGFKVEFAAKGVPRTSPFAGGSFKADFSVQGTDWQVVSVPFDSFSYDWSDFTGECNTKDPDGKQHVCCSTEHPEVCPKAKFLGDITAIAIWAEGSAGDFHIEVQWVGAGESKPVCKATEYCCPDAKACLTPTKKSCKDDTGACGKGEVCCPLTKICVIPGKPCVTPCADSGTYCCPDAVKCLKPTNPGVFCKAADDCKSNEVCCPLTKLCVAPGADCKPSFLK